MELDLLYEIDAPKPWPGKTPYGKKAFEQAAYREAIEQIKLADRIGFHTSWHVEHHFREGRSHSPAPEGLLGALSQVTEQMRLRSAGARRADAPAARHPDEGRGGGGTGRHHADGADRLRRRPGGEPRPVE